jgi:hypothetical protein
MWQYGKPKMKISAEWPTKLDSTLFSFGVLLIQAHVLASMSAHTHSLLMDRYAAYLVYHRIIPAEAHYVYTESLLALIRCANVKAALSA